MKVKRKKICIVISAILAIILLFPLKIELKDGGTKEYVAVLYSVTYKHSLDSKDGDYGYSIGTIIRVLFFEVYNDVTFFSEETVRQKHLY